jgi:hyperosmotically inducible protein
VNEDIDKELAGQIALGVDGIKEVQNDIEVKADYEPARDRKDSSFGDKVDDFSITARVKSKLQ